jgi:hypothetical protein
MVRAFALAPFLAIAGVLAGGSGADFVPDAARPGTMELDGTTWTHDAPGLRVRVRRLDEGERQDYLRRVAGSHTDPFATAGDRPPRFATFLLEVDNRDQARLALHAESLWLVTEGDRIHHPVGLEQLAADYALVGDELPAAYEQVRPALVQGAWILSAGEKAAGLVVYPAVPPRTKRFRVDVQLTLANGDVVRVSAPYRRPKQAG